MPTRRGFLIGAAAAAASTLVLPGLTSTALAQPGGAREASRTAERMDRQSPIDIRTALVEDRPNADPLVIDYPNNVDLELEYVRKDGDGTSDPGCGVHHPEETVEAFHFSRPASVRLDGERYELLQFHFHTSSEHKVDGNGHPIEQHFVHQRVSDGKLLVVGVFLRRGGTGTVQDQVLRTLPQECGDHVEVTGVNLRRSFPDDLRTYTYGGSLTTDPFDQRVRWHVMHQPVHVENDTINRFQALFPAGNARPTQPLNGRTVRLIPGRLA